MTGPPFRCPKCGGPYFGRAVAPDGAPLPTARCHGDSSAGPRACGWRGDRPPRVGGRPVFPGTRVPVELVREKLAAGESVDNVLADYPFLSREDVERCRPSST